ncbi:MAG TPA: enolase C-terminal domain-like protein [Tepidisphaeraceae bacterium]|jgi:L-alanine-DL-glutamate epimerase-like enolase superfamily enzyme|nr:enolase C-terminal domain-like protein [Tepidisphaeraceae bacterium]
MNKLHESLISRVDVHSYRIPTDAPESDGTLTWDHTDLIVALVAAGEFTGIGWTYASQGSATIARSLLASTIIGQPSLAVEANWQAMARCLRNAGRPGAGLMAMAAIDVALWDLKAKLLGISLVDLFGSVRNAVPIYGSGGFTSYSEQQLAEQLGGWVQAGIGRVKMKVGRDPKADPNRVRFVRKCIGDQAELFVDANGGYSRKQSTAMARHFADESGVSWFEEPVSSDDLQGLRLIRDRAPAGMDIAAGEYGDTLDYFRRMISAGAVDCLQADATRCGGYTGFLKVAALCEAFHIPLSAHCAPQLHAHVGCAVEPLRHIEYFHDNVRIDHLLFDGVLEPKNGTLEPDRSGLGHGLTLKTADAARYLV